MTAAAFITADKLTIGEADAVIEAIARRVARVNGPDMERVRARLGPYRIEQFTRDNLEMISRRARELKGMAA